MDKLKKKTNNKEDSSREETVFVLQMSNVYVVYNLSHVKTERSYQLSSSVVPVRTNWEGSMTFGGRGLN